MHKLVPLILIMFFTWPAEAQVTNRPPAVAGSFYASDPKALTKDLEFLFSRALPTKPGNNPLAIIAPHAGYPFSGEVAATAYNQLDPGKSYKNVFILGNSHNFSFNGAAIFSSENFETPLGEVPVNHELARKLRKENKVFVDHDAAHMAEHSLEVQLPFLQYYLKKDFKILPILLGTRSLAQCKQLAEALKPYLNEDNLFVISADFSHYPEYRSANIVDIKTANALCTNDPEQFISALKLNEEENIPNLATSACAWPSILSLIYMTQDDKDHLEYELVRYQNSGDTRIGDKSRVVGYCAITVRQQEHKNNSSFMLSKEDKTVLIDIARKTIDLYVRSEKIHKVDKQYFSEALQTHTGAFVTLHKNGELRGCIGRFQPDKPLYEVVRDMAISASTKDYRFKPVKAGELDEIELEISVLTPLEPISDPSEIKLGQHGIYIKKGHNSGTFLPQVATQTGWNLEEFLGHCARDKAQIGWFGWKDAELYIYEALIFTEEDCKHE
ncbi:AmmeMemoRadiSam system protein B [Bacteroidota bacterium]